MKKIFILLLILTFHINLFSQNLEGFKPFTSMEEIFKKENLNGKPIFLEAYLPDCPHCKAFIPTFQNPAVVDFLKTINAYQMNMEDPEIRKYLFEHQIMVTSTPTFLLFDEEGDLIYFNKAHSDINTPELVLKTLKEAIAPENRPKVLKEKLADGTFNGNDLLRLAQYSKGVLDTALNAAIMQQIALKIPEENYSNAGIIKLMAEAMIEENNPLFNYMIHHIDRFYETTDSNTVRYIIENTIMNNLFAPNSPSYSRERLDEMKFGLKSLGLDEKMIASRFIVVEVKKSLKESLFQEAIELIKEFYSENEIPEKEKEYWCNELKLGNYPGECPF